MIKKLPQRRGLACSARLLAIDSIEGLVHENAKACNAVRIKREFHLEICIERHKEAQAQKREKDSCQGNQVRCHPHWKVFDSCVPKALHLIVKERVGPRLVLEILKRYNPFWLNKLTVAQHF